MIIEKTSTPGELLTEWRARVRCDFPECGLVLVLCGFLYPADELTDERITRRIEDEGWYCLGTTHLCSPRTEVP